MQKYRMGGKEEISAVSETQKGISAGSCLFLHPPTPLSNSSWVWLFMVEACLRTSEG